MSKPSKSRRKFIQKTIATSTALAAGGILPGFSAESYGRILNANNKIRISVMGVNSRGKALAQNFAQQENCDVLHIVDVDSRAVDSCLEAIKERQRIQALGYKDVRKSLESL